MNKQKVYLNSCQIIIDSFTLYKNIQQPTYYFVWKKGKKFNKSNLYDVQLNEPVAAREKMEMNLKLYKINGKTEPKNTHLYFMAGAGSSDEDIQVCQFALGVHEWNTNYQRVVLQIKQEGKTIGVINLQARKRQIMELENFHKYTAEIEQSSEGESSMVIASSARDGSRNNNVIQLQKQVQDLKYLNQKLKKDRAFLIARNDVLEKQIVHIKSSIEGELKRVQEYFERKLSIHTSIYQQQIQELITTFNENSNINTIIMKEVIQENQALAASLTQLRIISEEEMEKQEKHYKQKVMDLEEQRDKLEENVQELYTKIEADEKQITETQKKLQSTKEELDNMTLSYGIDKKQFKSKCQNYEKQLQTLRKQISDLKNDVSEKQQQLEQSNTKNQQLKKQLDETNLKLQRQLTEKIKLQTDLQTEKQMIEAMKIEKQANLHVIRKLEEDYQAYISESEKKNIEFQKQIQEIQLQGKEREMEFDNMINEERQKYFSENLKLTEVTMKLEDAEKTIIVREQEIKTFIDENTKLNEQFLEEHAKTLELFQKLAQSQNEVQHHKLMFETSETKVQLLTDQLDQAYKKSQQELEAMRLNADEAIKTREKLFEQEIINLRQKLQLNQNSYLKLNQDFRAEIEVYKRQLQKLQQQSIKQIQQYNQISAINRKLEFENAQFKVLLEDTKQMMKEKEKKYEESLKMFLSSSQMAEDLRYSMSGRNDRNQRGIKKGLTASGSLELELQSSNEARFSGEFDKNKYLDPSNTQTNRFQLKIPKFDTKQQIPEMNQNQQNQYKRIIQQLGSLQHIRYLKSVEQTNKQYQQYIDDLQKQQRHLAQKYKELNRVNVEKEEENESLRGELQQLEQIIQMLKTKQIEDQLKASDKPKQIPEKSKAVEDKPEQKKQAPKITEEKEKQVKGNQQLARKIEEKHKALEEKRMKKLQKQASQKQVKIQMVDQQVQVETITMEDILNAQKYFQLAISKGDGNTKPKLMNSNEGLLSQSQKQKEQQSPGMKVLPPKNKKHQSLQENKKKKIKTEREATEQNENTSYRQYKHKTQAQDLQLEIVKLAKKLKLSEEQNEQKNTQLSLKNHRIQKLELRNKELFDQLCSVKQDLGLKISQQESKLLLQYSSLNEIQKMKNTIMQKENELKDIEHTHLLQRNKITYENEQLANENKKLKSQIDDMIEKGKRNTGYDYTKMMQQDIEDANKRIIELNRSINQLRMEKQSAEDQARMLKKKMADLQKSLSETNEKKSFSENELESMTRKFNKAKRDLEERDSDLSKMKDQYKKIQQQISSYSTISSQNLLERKKFLQQKLEMEQELNKKEAENRKLQKQLSKQLQNLENNNENFKNSNQQTAKSLQRTQLQLIKAKKTVREQQQQIQYLTKKLSISEEQSRTNMEEMKANFRQKLNIYINQINEIKNILSTSDEEIQFLNSQKLKLKIQLDKAYVYIGELEEQNTNINEEKAKLNGELSKKLEEMQEIRKELMHYQEDCIDLHNKLVGLQDEINKERMISVNKTQRMEEYENLSEKYLYELKNLKVILSEYEKKENIKSNLGKQVEQLSKQNQSLTEQIISMKKQYDKYRIEFTYSKNQLQQLVNEIKDSYDQAHKKQLADTLDELDQEYQAKNIKREKEIIQLYNENAKMKVQIQSKQDQNSSLLQRYTEIEAFPQKYRQLKDQYDVLVNEIKCMRQEQISTRNKIQRLQSQIKELQRINGDLKNQIQLALTTLTNQKVRTARLEQELIEAQTGYSLSRQEIKKLSSNHNDKSEQLKILIQNYQQKILSIQLENTRIKQRQQNMHKEYKDQLSKMQQRIKQASSTLYHQNITIQRQYKGKVAEKDRLLKQANKQIAIVSENLKNLQEQIDILKQENDELAAELANTRVQMAEDEDIYISEINKLKNNLRDMEQAYTQNTNELEEELAELNRQLTLERLNNRQNTSLGSSRLRQSEVERRLEERVRAKDAKIQQLKNNIFILEETVINLKKRNETDELLEKDGQYSKYRALYNELLIEHEGFIKKRELQRQKQESLIKTLKKQLATQKQIATQFELKYDHQNLQLQSLRCQLSTLKQIYENLQRQVDKRQLKLAENTNIHSIYEKQLEIKANKITQLQQKLLQIREQYQKVLQKLRTKDNQISIINERLEIEIRSMSKIKNKDSNLAKINEFKEVQFSTMREDIEKLSKQNKRLQHEIEIYKGQLNGVKNRENQLDRLVKKLSRDNKELVEKIYANEEIVGKYTTLNEKSLENYNANLQQLVLGGYFDEKFFDQEQELNQLKQDLEQMKFNKEREQLDYEQMKRVNLELQLKMEDYQFVNDQVENLRKICDKLEEQKKIAVFREEAIRVRLTNLISKGQERDNIKDGLEAILNYNNGVYV